MPPRPVSVTIFGILNIGFAVFGLGTLALTKIIMAFVKLPGNNPMMAFTKDPAYVAWMKVATTMGLVSYPVLLVAGIALLLLKNWGRITSIVYGVYAIIWALVNFYVATVVLGPLMHQSMGRMGSISSAVGVVSAMAGLVFSLAYPILLLIFMTRPNVVAAFRAAPLTTPAASGLPPAIR